MKNKIYLNQSIKSFCKSAHYLDQRAIPSLTTYFFLYFSKTKCKDNEFSCTMGTCIPLIKRCDEEKDCGDFSDEDKCVLVDIDKNYKVENAPPLHNGSGTGSVQFSLKLVFSKIFICTGHFLYKRLIIS